MGVIRLIVLALIIALPSCRQPPQYEENNTSGRISTKSYTLTQGEYSKSTGGEALLLTRYRTLEELKSEVDIYYEQGQHPSVYLTCRFGDREVISILESGISQSELLRARDGNIWVRLMVALQSPYAGFNKRNLMRIEDLGRRKPYTYGKGDVVFYDLAEAMLYNISDDDILVMASEELSGKGYVNTFNHIIAQAFMTSLFSERFADFVADVHERLNLAELVSGNFKESQLTDLENGPVDNYIDMLNNEWGQELGKSLNIKYKIHPDTDWTPDLLANYLNDIQNYHSWIFQIRFKPFRGTDDLVIRFSNKLNNVMKGVPK